jgi:putative ABC transport system permease protein
MGWRGVWKLALRDLRGGLSSFRVFLACLALGVAGLAAVGSIVAAIENGLNEKAQSLLGGDVSVQLTYRFAERDERAALSAIGELSEVVNLRGMARVEDDASVVQIKAVDQAYPLYGELVLEPPIALADALARTQKGSGQKVAGQEVAGVVVEPALLTRLNIGLGDQIAIGAERFEVRATIVSEPDRLPSGVDFGPRAIIAVESIEAAELAQAGTLFDTEYRVKLAGDQSLAELRESLPQRFPESGWRWRDYEGGAPGVERIVTRLGSFLTLVGLAALAVGGLGVGASVRAYLDSKTETIATLKTIGAKGRVISSIYLIQITILACLGVGAGLFIGAGAPIAFAPLLSERLPVPANFGVYPAPLAEAALYGMLAAYFFSLWPLARARDIRAAGLFRDLVAPERHRLSLADIAAIASVGLTLSTAIIIFSSHALIAGAFIAGVAVALVLLAWAGQGVAWLAERLARSRLGRRDLALRLALSNMAGSGAAGARAETRGALLALGLGLIVLTTIGLIDVNLRRLVSDQLPDRAPAYFVIDVQDAQIATFTEVAKSAAGVTSVETAPMLRGVITAINGIKSTNWMDQQRGDPAYYWILRGDRGVTYSADPPEGTEITEGEWWRDGDAGEPAVSFSDEHGKGLGLKLGDRISVNILGRDITARITSFRTVAFRDGGINFLMLFNPGVLQHAPHSHIATIYGDEPQPGAYLRLFAEKFPATTSIRMTEVLDRVSGVLGDVANAARIGAVATLITGLVVLIGAAAAAQRRQIYQAAILKTLGAAQWSVVRAILWRAGLLGLAAALVAFIVGAAGAWAVTKYIFETRFILDVTTAVIILLGGVSATMVTSAIFLWGPLSARPARVLRARD